MPVFRWLLGIHLWVGILGHRLCIYSSVLHMAKQLPKVFIPSCPTVSVWKFQLLHIYVKLKVTCFFIFMCILSLKSRLEPPELCDKQRDIIKFVATVLIPWILVYASDSGWYYIKLETLLNSWWNKSYCLQWKILQKFAFLTFGVVAFSSEQCRTIFVSQRAKEEKIKNMYRSHF